MTKKHIKKLVQDALSTLKQSGQLTANCPDFQIDIPKDKSHGDFAANVAMVLARVEGENPRKLAQFIIDAIPPSPYVRQLEIAGPGFINFFLSDEARFSVITDIISTREHYGRSTLSQKKRLLVEFMSANPTGPLHVGHGRHAAYGAVVSDLLEAIGYEVTREYYVNDAGRQMDILATSAWLRYIELSGVTLPFPANAYKGLYVIEIAKKLRDQYQDKLIKSEAELFSGLPLDESLGGDKEIYIDAMVNRAKSLLGTQEYSAVFDMTLNSVLTDIQDDLREFGVHFQNWFSERAFVQSDVVARTIDHLKSKQFIYVADGALWFKATALGDEKDRVLQRSNGQHTYFANDLAYHINKFERGFDFAIDIFGADHHGYIPRMQAGLEANGITKEKLTYLLVQFVTLYRGGEQVQMSTRSGSFVTLRELREEVGNDAARFFYVMRRCEHHVDFDLDLAKSQSNENPVYYIQYAHARICSVWRQLKEKNLSYDETVGLNALSLLITEQETQLITTLSRYEELIGVAARQYEPHLLTHYLRELATSFHAYYNSSQFLVSDDALRSARLVLIDATRQIFRNGLKLLGVSCPESM